MLEDLKSEIAQVEDSVDQTAAMLSLKESTCTPFTIFPVLDSLTFFKWRLNPLQ